MDGVEVELLGQLGEGQLAGAGAVLGVAAEFEVLLGGVGDDLAQQLGELGGVLGLFERVALEGLGDLGIALALGDAGHRQVHADLAALAVEVLAQTVQNALVNVLGDADHVLAGPDQLGSLNRELRAGALAERALRRGLVAFVDVAADRADILLHLLVSPSFGSRCAPLRGTMRMVADDAAAV